VTHEEDFKSKVHELFAQVAEHLDPQLDKLIRSGCGIVDDHEANDNGLALCYPLRTNERLILLRCAGVVTRSRQPS